MCSFCCSPSTYLHGWVALILSKCNEQSHFPARTELLRMLADMLKLIKNIKINYELYLLSIPAFACIILFCYVPMYGIIIAFQDFDPIRGFSGSNWVGFDHFSRFFRSFQFSALLENTIGLSLYSIIAGFPCPIIFALMINETKNKRFSTFVQTVSYAPHFISTIVLVGMIMIFTSPRYGIINHIITLFGGKAIDFMAEPKWFKTLYVFSGIWQELGWNAIIYIAALSNVDTALHEAAKIDGASTLKRIIHIDLPGIMPIITIHLILSAGSVLGVGFEKAFLMQNTVNRSSSEVIATYVYKVGLLGAEYSFSAAVGLFNSVVNFIVLVLVNQIAKKSSETSLW